MGFLGKQYWYIYMLQGFEGIYLMQTEFNLQRVSDIQDCF
jgi:hypothetical protein